MASNLDNYGIFSQSSVLEKDKLFNVFGNGKYMRSEDNKFAIIVETIDSSKPLVINENTEVVLNIKDLIQKDGTVNISKNIKKFQIAFSIKHMDDFIKKVVIDKDNENFVIKDDVLFTKDLKELVLYFKRNNESYTIPDTVEICGKDAFDCQEEKQSLRKIVLSKNLKNLRV